MSEHTDLGTPVGRGEATAGRALDEQVCEAMGINPRVEYGATRDGGASWMYTSRDRSLSERWVATVKDRYEGYEDMTVEEIRDYPRVSENMSEAMLIVDEMARRGFHARLKTPFTPDDPYFAGFTPHGSTGWNGRGDYEASGETLPLAICCAALAFATYWPELPPSHARGVPK